MATFRYDSNSGTMTLAGLNYNSNKAMPWHSIIMSRWSLNAFGVNVQEGGKGEGEGE